MNTSDSLDTKIRRSLAELISRAPLAPEFDRLVETPDSSRRPRLLLAGLATLAAIAVVVTGFTLSDNAETTLDTSDGPETSPVPADTATTSFPPPMEQMETTLYMLHREGDTGQLAPLGVTMDVGSTPADRVEALFAWRPPATSESGVHTLVNAVPRNATVLSATIEPSTTRLTIDTDGLLSNDGISQPDLIRALAQIVWTATEDPAVTEVQFRDSGIPVAVIDSEGRILDRPVNRSDYQLAD